MTWFDLLATFGAFSSILYRLWKAEHPPTWFSFDALQWVAFGGFHFVAFASVSFRLGRLMMGLTPLPINTSIFYLAIAGVILIPVPHYDRKP